MTNVPAFTGHFPPVNCAAMMKLEPWMMSVKPSPGSQGAEITLKLPSEPGPPGSEIRLPPRVVYW